MHMYKMRVSNYTPFWGGHFQLQSKKDKKHFNYYWELDTVESLAWTTKACVKCI